MTVLATIRNLQCGLGGAFISPGPSPAAPLGVGPVPNPAPSMVGASVRKAPAGPTLAAIILVKAQPEGDMGQSGDGDSQPQGPGLLLESKGGFSGSFGPQRRGLQVLLGCLLFGPSYPNMPQFLHLWTGVTTPASW